MDPARIALARRISSDSIDSFGLVANRPPIRKGKKRGTKKNKTKICDIKGEDLRSPPSPIAEGVRHSDRAPDKRLRVLRDDLQLGETGGTSAGRKRSLKTKKTRRTRSLSPQTFQRKSCSTELLRWKPVELLSVAAQSGLAPNNIQTKDVDQEQKRDGDESSLGSLIEAIEAEFGGSQEMSVYHQSTSSLPAVPIYTADEQVWAGNEKLIRFSPDADALISLSSAPPRKQRSDTDVCDNTKTLRKPSMGKDTNHASMGTLSTENSTQSTSLGDHVLDLFSALAPSSSDKPSPPVKLNPPSLHNPNVPPAGVEKLSSSPKKKTLSRKKEAAVSVSSTDSQWLEFVTPFDPKKVTSNATSTVGDIKAYKADSSGTIDSMNSEEVQKNLGNMGGKSLSALGMKDVMSPTRKKDLLRATAHCSPRQVSKHTGLSSLSAHTSSSSGRSMSSAYLLERLPLEPPLTEKSSKKHKKRSSSPKKSKKASTDSIGESVEQFSPPKSTQQPTSETVEVSESSKELTVTTARSPRRGRRPGKKDTNVIVNTLAIMSSDPAVVDTIKKPQSYSDGSLLSVEIFEPDVTPKTQAEFPTTGNGGPSSSSVPLAGVASLATVVGYTPASAETVMKAERQPASRAKSDVSTHAGFLPENLNQPLSPTQQRSNPPARPWGGKESVGSETLVSSIKELSMDEAGEESMLNALITSLKKDHSTSANEPLAEVETARKIEEEHALPVPQNEDSKLSPPSQRKGPTTDETNDAKKDGTGNVKSSKTTKKITRKTKTKSFTTDIVSGPSDPTGQAETTECATEEPGPITAKTRSRSKTPKSPKSSSGKAIDASNTIPLPPFTSPRTKTPTRLRKPVISACEQAPPPSESTSQTRRARSRKPSSRALAGNLAKEPKSSIVSGGEASDKNLLPRKRTPTRTRPGGEPVVVSAGRKTPTRARPRVEDENIVERRLSTRTRPGTGDGEILHGKTTPTRARHGEKYVNASGERKTPIRTRPTLGGKKTPPRSRPTVEGGKEIPPKTRVAVGGGKKTPTRTRPVIDVGAGTVEREPAIDAEEVTKDDGVPTSPTSARVTVDQLSSVRVRRSTDVTTNKVSIDNPELLPIHGHKAPDPPAILPGHINQGPVPDPPAATHAILDSPRVSTPQRIRRAFNAAAERVTSACRTPPRERNGRTLSAVRGERPARERSFSPFSGLRRLTSRTPPRDRLSDNPDDPRPARRRVVSQSPPRERRITRNLSGSLSPIPLRPGSTEEWNNQLTLEPLQSLPGRHTLSGRRRPSASDSKSSQETKDSQITHSSTRARTPTRRKRKSDSESGAGGRTKTPTRSRRGNRTVDGDAPKMEEKPIGKVSIRPRRRGGDSSSGTTLSEKTSPTVVSPLSCGSPQDKRRKTPTRGPPTTRPQTPTRTTKTVLRRGVSDRRFDAPDPPGENKSNLRSQSASRSRRSHVQARSRSIGRAMIASPSMQLSTANHSLAELFE